MAPRKPAAAAPAAAEPAAPARTRTSRAGTRRGSAAGLRTFAEAAGARDTVQRSDKDADRVTRSFLLSVGLVERAKATADGIQHRAYGTDLEDRIPRSLAALVAEAIEVACSWYEDELNNGEEFRRIRQLTPGPSPEGAREGARKRAAARAAKTGSD